MKNTILSILLFSLLSITLVSNAQYWSNVNIDTNNFDLREVIFTPEGRGLITGTYVNFTYLSDSGGVYWIKGDTIKGQGINRIFFLKDSSRIAVGVDGVVYGTTNQGQSWDSLTRPINEAFYGIHFINNDTGYIVGKHGSIFKTIDKGLSWNSLNSGTTASLWDIHFVDENIGIVTGDGRILRTTNAGQNWTEVHTDLPKQYKNMAFIDSQTGFIAGSQGEILKTTDAGANWTNVFTGSSTKHFKGIYFYDSNYGYVVGLSGIMYRTLDGGTTWSSISTPTTQHLEGIYIHNNDTALAVGENGTVLINTHASGIGEWKLVSELVKIYPNPTIDYLYFENLNENSDIQIEIYNSTGQLLKSENIKNKSRFSIDVRNLSKGLCYLKIIFGDKVQIDKIIIQ